MADPLLCCEAVTLPDGRTFAQWQLHSPPRGLLMELAVDALDNVGPFLNDVDPTDVLAVD
ncbi:hypothetical protein [Trinickia mobilis]|uniref:hypothetical protein n=1 Tax=Trinickia mobilis TaxID=2816356 RepID=UPI001A8E06DD|nr:hypothetical protein [Trinickia mobilis]